MNIRKIYFDMDGVLADFDRGVLELCGLVSTKQDSCSDMDDLMWKKIKETGHFYDKLEMMPGAKSLFDAVYNIYGDRCEILTGIPKPVRGILTAGEDKINWVRRKLSDTVVVNIVFREDKPNFCKGKDCLLIDDLERNILDWEKAGGTGILCKDCSQTLQKMMNLGLIWSGQGKDR